MEFSLIKSIIKISIHHPRNHLHHNHLSSLMIPMTHHNHHHNYHSHYNHKHHQDQDHHQELHHPMPLDHMRQHHNQHNPVLPRKRKRWLFKKTKNKNTMMNIRDLQQHQQHELVQE